MARLPRTDALIVAVLRDALPPSVVVGTRIPDAMRLPYVMARRSGGSSIHPEFVDAALVDVQVWAGSDEESERLAQAARDALYRASRFPQFVLAGVGSVAHFVEESAPTVIPSDVEDHNTVRYQASYTIHTRP